MSTYSQQISNAEFLYYQEQFAEAALSGTTSDDALRATAIIVKSVNTDTFTPTHYDDVIASRNVFIQSLLQSAEQINIDAISLSSMQPAFIGLAAHISEWTGGTLDEYLTATGLKVHPTFASIAALSGSPISSSNIDT